MLRYAVTTSATLRSHIVIGTTKQYVSTVRSVHSRNSLIGMTRALSTTNHGFFDKENSVASPTYSRFLYLAHFVDLQTYFLPTQIVGK